MTSTIKQHGIVWRDTADNLSLASCGFTAEYNGFCIIGCSGASSGAYYLYVKDDTQNRAVGRISANSASQTVMFPTIKGHTYSCTGSNTQYIFRNIFELVG